MQLLKLGELNMDKRIYKNKYSNKGELLVKEEYKNCTYYIVTFGTHPCAYVDVSGFNLSEEDIKRIKCHGGVTYFENSFYCEPKKLITIAILDGTTLILKIM